MGKLIKKIFGREKKEKADKFEGAFHRSEDPRLVATKFKNTGNEPLFFESILEANSILEEAPTWKRVKLPVGAELVFPHLYFIISTESGEPCHYEASPAPKGSDFLYKPRAGYSF